MLWWYVGDDLLVNWLAKLGGLTTLSLASTVSASSVAPRVTRVPKFDLADYAILILLERKIVFN